jgi:hypothetical protein
LRRQHPAAGAKHADGQIVSRVWRRLLAMSHVSCQSASNLEKP